MKEAEIQGSDKSGEDEAGATREHEDTRSSSRRNGSEMTISP